MDSYLVIVKTVVELSKGQWWILKFAAVMTACKFLKLNLETLLNFILDFTKLIRGQDLTRKEAEIREAEFRIKILELEQTQTQNSSSPEIISNESNPTHINPPQKNATSMPPLMHSFYSVPLIKTHQQSMPPTRTPPSAPHLRV